MQRSRTKRSALRWRSVFQARYGCAIEGATDSVDFDFGENGEIDGFAASSLWEFAVASKKDYGFASEEEIAAAITRSAAEGALRFSGSILYYVQKRG